MPTRQLPDPRQEREAKALMETLRCLVCQGQSIADSDAEMAGDMRAMVRQRILAGERPEQIRAWLISRYGNWVSYDPPLEPATWPLWAAPALLLFAGLWLAASASGGGGADGLGDPPRPRRRHSGRPLVLRRPRQGRAAVPRRRAAASLWPAMRFQGHPGLRGSPKAPPARLQLPESDFAKTREDMLGRFDRASSWLTISESYARRGDTWSAAEIIRSGLRAFAQRSRSLGRPGQARLSPIPTA